MKLRSTPQTVSMQKLHDSVVQVVDVGLRIFREAAKLITYYFSNIFFILFMLHFSEPCGS
jgi:hypothetical protein